jgi:DNA polymerase-3 subunit epsilon
VIQVGLVKRYPDGKETTYKTLINPGTQIPPEAIEVHHITDEMVANAPRFAAVAGVLAKGLAGCDVAGYNAPFDVRMLNTEFLRLRGPDGPIKDVFKEVRLVDSNRIFKHYHRRNLAAAVEEYLGASARAEFEQGAHDAMVDASWTLRVLDAQMARHEDLPDTPEGLDQMFFWSATGPNVDASGRWVWRFGHPVFAFGKHVGVPLKQVPLDYLQWMLKQDFNDDVKEIVTKALKGVYPVRTKPLPPSEPEQDEDIANGESNA